MDELIFKRRRMREIINDDATKQIISSLQLPSNSKGLELGAGIGSIAAYLSVLFPNGQVHAVDLNQQNIDEINSRYIYQTNLKAYFGDVHSLNIKKEKYDLIHARFLFEHIVDWKDVVIQLCKNNLNPGGVVFFEDAVYSERIGYIGSEIYNHVMTIYSKSVSEGKEKWNCALQTAKVFNQCGLIDIHSVSNMQIFLGKTITSEYFKNCFIENAKKLNKLGVSEDELESVIQELDKENKCFSGPFVFQSYGRKKASVEKMWDLPQNQNVYPTIRLVLVDCDGCLTDGGIYYTEAGDELKKFNTRDGMGVAMLKEHGVLIGIITGEGVKLVERRAEKLRFDILEMNCINKKTVIQKICKTHNIRLENVAFIGDDINDLEALSIVGLSCCPADATEGVKMISSYITKAKGGEGVLREVAEFVLKINTSNSQNEMLRGKC